MEKKDTNGTTSAAPPPKKEKKERKEKEAVVVDGVWFYLKRSPNWYWELVHTGSLEWRMKHGMA